MEFKDFSRTSPKIRGLFKTVRARVIYKFINMSLQHIVLLEASTRSPQSHTCLNGLFLFHFWLFSDYSFHNYPSLYGSWREKKAFNWPH